MDALPLYLTASLLLIITPGPDFLFVLGRGVVDGRGAGLMSAAGVSAGILVHTLAAALGLAVLLSAVPRIFWILKMAGGLYLLVQGLLLIRDRQNGSVGQVLAAADLRACFVQGLVSNVCNPKVAFFFIAFLPQFVMVDIPGQGLAMAGLGLIYALMTMVFLALLALFAGRFSAWLNTERRAARFRTVSGILVMLLGLRLLLPIKG
ncbi:MAG: LysE family translocator [Desulfobulbaceae bacterium]|uniref:LysE family translocator n=1 Tax=Candidatus Desulfatifera sulfidica TaxID=2841691 RepID=A0A8J6TD28_9BACT|nr:LysE family translocator [Candidatus Desulfatifera sulfidica]